jgi:Domain of unknown function (DUF4412)
MIPAKSFTHSARSVSVLGLLLTVVFCAACGGATNSSSSSSSGSPGEAFEGEITSKMFMGDQAMEETRLSIKGARSRIEPLFSQDEAQTAIVLMDYSSGATTTLSPQTRSYATMNLVEMAEEMAKEAGEDSSLVFPKVTSTGESETIAGFSCRHWLIRDNYRDLDVCIAKGLGYYGGGPGGILDKLRDPALREKAKAQLDANPDFAKFVEGGAFPLKMAVIENGRSRVIMEVTRIERKSLDDSLFIVPADYRKEIP